MAELSPQRWAKAEDLFARALDLPHEERLAFLESECPDDEVRDEVASLLAHDSGQLLDFAGSAIASAAADLARDANPDDRLVGERLGPYRLVAIAGYGGMGAVYRAAREDGEFHQQVAIKLVRAAAASPNSLLKFRQERQILARLSHPNIARLLDGGSTPEGVPYLVMEFVEGQPITTWCETQKLSAQQRLQIFLAVCEGVEAANRDLVIHRDLKPANILVTRDGVPKLLDFGIAKLLNPDKPDATRTETRFQALTPEYAAPEQIRGEPVTAATDVYALGLVLFEVLTGLKAQRIAGRPSVILKTHPAGDLDKIVRMAVREEPARRYQTAAALADDIRRYLAGQPVAARPDTSAYRLAKFVGRHRISLQAGIVSAVCVVGGVILIDWLSKPARPPRLLQVLQLTSEARVAIHCRIATDGVRLFFTQQIQGRDFLAQVPVDGGTPSPLPLAAALSGPRVLDISPDRSSLLVAAGPESNYSQPVWIVPKAGGSARPLNNIRAWSAAWSRDGRRIFFILGSGLFRVNADGTDRQKLVDVPEGSYDLRVAPPPQAEALRFSVFQRDMLSSAIWEVAPDGAGLHLFSPRQPTGAPLPNAFYSGDWISSGRYYLLRSRQAGISTFWAMRENAASRATNGSAVKLYATPLESRSFLPGLDGKRVFFAAAQARADLVRYDPKRAQLMPIYRDISARYLAVSKDEREIAYTATPQDSLWKSLPDGSARVQLTSSNMRAFRPRWSPDGKYIAFTGSEAGQPTRGYVIPSAGGTPEAIDSAPFETSPSWSPVGSALLVTRTVPNGATGTPGLYTVDWKTRKTELVPGSGPLALGEWSPNARYIAAVLDGVEVKLFDVRTQHWSVLARGSGIGALFWSRDGESVFFQDRAGVKGQPVFRARIHSRKVEQVMTLSQIPQSDVTAYTLMGLAHGGSLVANVMRSNSDIYALDVDLP